VPTGGTQDLIHSDKRTREILLHDLPDVSRLIRTAVGMPHQRLRLRGAVMIGLAQSQGLSTAMLVRTVNNSSYLTLIVQTFRNRVHL